MASIARVQKSFERGGEVVDYVEADVAKPTRRQTRKDPVSGAARRALQVRAWIDLVEAGYSCRSVAESYGYSEQHVRARIKLLRGRLKSHGQEDE